MKMIKRTLILLIIATTVFTVVKCNRIEDADNIKQQEGDDTLPKDDTNKKDEQDKEEKQEEKKESKVDETEKKHIEVEPKEYIKMSPDVDLQAERKNKNNYDIVGRLEIPDLFNILIVRGKDNQYYLNRSIEKKQDVRGSEFMDYRAYPSSKQINIYGHNSRDKNIKVPFLRLESFLDESFFNKNPYIIFQHDSGKNIYKIITKEVLHKLCGTFSYTRKVLRTSYYIKAIIVSSLRFHRFAQKLKSGENKSNKKFVLSLSSKK